VLCVFSFFIHIIFFRFPIIFDYIGSNNCANDVYSAGEIWPNSDWKDELRTLRTWIKQLPTFNIARQVEREMC
jgi:hypothetical protein